MNRKALGRGLGALLSSDTTVDLAAEPTEVDVDAIVPGPMQPRTHFDEGSLEGLADSIRSHGIVQPLLVRRQGERYELIAGERRWRAAQIAGLTKVPVLVRDVPDKDLLEIALIENIQRENLNAIEEAQAYKRLIETVGLTQEELAARVGRDRSYITNYLRLLKLPEDLQKLVVEGRLSTGHARTILGLSHVDLQRKVARQVIDGGLSVRATEHLVRKAVEGAPAKTASTVDPNVRAAESKLRRALGTQVRIVQLRGEGQGKVEISFFSNQDLDRIYNLLLSASRPV
ncbi:MAG: ParB/RepB/Spo0J family partition protein [Acidobacteria bacterium]|nr:ParB/RepB/Spo0J family partition protein [Acidobacteriota bacterium]MCA1627724.1 ParB/RepB/Spo0J family partition protein [Acidobacteriota bacterium]